MSVVCATNLSPESTHAGTVAAAVAARLSQPLVLYGLLEQEGYAPESAPFTELRGRLEVEAERLRAFDVEVRTVLCSGEPEVELLRDEACRKAQLLLLAGQGWSDTSLWRRAPLSERLVRHASCPVLVVQRHEALLDWARGRRRLLVLAGVDASEAVDAPLAFLHALREVGPCDIIAAYVCSPAEERQRLGIHTPVHVELLDPVVRHIEKLDPEVERILLRELKERVGELPGEGRVELHLEPGYGRRADHLLHVVRERRADLVVVGTHQRAGLQRLWHGSVSEGVLRHAEQSVVCVPAAYARPRRAAGPPRSVLVPVDFSEASLHALAQARTLVAPGGRIHLLHVHERKLSDPAWADHYGVLPEPPGEQEEVLRRLQALVPPGDGGVRWSVEGVSGSDVAQAICQAAEREGVELVCVGATEGRLGALSAVTRALMARSHRPVLAVPASPAGRGPPGWGPPELHGG
jgi:nucleotide-binding universal stress UspA family protein